MAEDKIPGGPTVGVRRVRGRPAEAGEGGGVSDIAGLLTMIFAISTILAIAAWRIEVWLERIARAVGWTDLPQEKPPVGLMDGLTDEERRHGRGTGWGPRGR